MDKTVSLEELGFAIAEIVNSYCKELKDEIDKTVELTARETLEEVKQKAPVYTYRYRGRRTPGKYKRNIKLTKEYNIFGNRSYIVHVGGRQYGLAHLLEDGHLLQNGRRTKPQKHWKPAEENAQRKLYSRVDNVIQRLWRICN